ncbi:MAG: hypothetical protein HY908_08635 [Myxococcales bacterium]|nr:hypothetical protein [Myxococcales bacterium]
MRGLFRTALSHALASAADAGGDPAVARRELRVDPVLGWLARARLHKLLAAARREAPDATSAELCQRAFLILHARPLGPAADRAALTAAYAAAQWERPRGAALRRSYRVTALAALGALGLAVGAVVFALGRSGGDAGPAGAPERRYEQLPTGDVVAQLFGERLPRLVTALAALAERGARDEAASAEVREAAATLVDADAVAALGPEVVAAVGALAAALRAVVEQGTGAEPLADAVGALDAALGRARIPVYLDGDVLTYADGHRRPVVFAYRIEAERPWRSGERVVRALRLRRLDRLATRMLLMGMVRPGMREALVLLDQTEDELLRLLLPALAPGAPLAFSRRPEDDWPGRSSFELAAGEVERRELGAALGADGARAGTLLGERERILDGIETRLAAQGLRLVGGRTLELPDGWLDSLGASARPEERAALAALAPELARPELGRALAAATDALAGSIEMHEVEHRLDDGAELPIPLALGVRLGPAAVAGQGSETARRSSAELSAYLATLARDTATPGVNALLVARFLLVDAALGSVEMPAAAVILEGLGRELGLADAELPPGRPARERVAALVLALLGRPADEVRAAAARLWAASFGRPLPPLAPDGPLAAPAVGTARP